MFKSKIKYAPALLGNIFFWDNCSSLRHKQFPSIGLLMCSCGSTCLVSASPSLIYLFLPKHGERIIRSRCTPPTGSMLTRHFAFFHCLAFENGRFRQRKWVTTAQVYLNHQIWCIFVVGLFVEVVPDQYINIS